MLEGNIMAYLALDVETANADYSSICQIGIAYFEGGEVINTWSTLIDPEDYFDPFNISIHGISSSKVKGAPTFQKIYNELNDRITDKIVVHHMPFDRTAINRACTKNDLEIISAHWLDSAKIVRRTWEEFASRGYGLASISDYLNISFDHHDALEDAIAAGKVVYNACNKSGLSIEDWLDKIKKPIFPSTGISTTIKSEGNPEGPLYGENIVFTGALAMTRSEAAKIAADLGCNVSNSVTKKTTLLVVGTQDKTKLAGYEKSSKHRRAEELIAQGILLRILSEKDFTEICNAHCSDITVEIA